MKNAEDENILIEALLIECLQECFSCTYTLAYKRIF